MYRESEISKRKLDEVYMKYRKIGDRLKRIEIKGGNEQQIKTFKKGYKHL